MSNKATVISQFEEFLKSDDKGVLITGTHQYEKHKLAMAVIDKYFRNANILFRINSLQNICDAPFLGWAGVKKQPKAGEKIKIGKNFYQFDSFNNEGTWYKTDHKVDIAIIYPIDAMFRNNNFKAIKDLFEFKNIDKIIMCSWTDKADYDYSLLSEYYNTYIIYDALEEDPEYHKRVLEHF